MGFTITPVFLGMQSWGCVGMGDTMVLSASSRVSAKCFSRGVLLLLPADLGAMLLLLIADGGMKFRRLDGLPSIRTRMCPYTLMHKYSLSPPDWPRVSWSMGRIHVEVSRIRCGIKARWGSLRGGWRAALQLSVRAWCSGNHLPTYRARAGSHMPWPCLAQEWMNARKRFSWNNLNEGAAFSWSCFWGTGENLLIARCKPWDFWGNSSSQPVPFLSGSALWESGTCI